MTRTTTAAGGLGGGRAALQRRHGAADRAWRCDDAVVPWLAAAAVLLVVFVLVERRTADPILPLDLFRLRIVSRSLAVVFMTGMAMFGAIAFVPLFVQGVMGGTATQAGQVLTPLFLGWVGTSVVGARLTVAHRLSDRRRRGGVLLLAGFVALAMIDADASMMALLRRCSCSAAGWACRCCRCCWRCSTASSARSSGWRHR